MRKYDSFALSPFTNIKLKQIKEMMQMLTNNIRKMSDPKIHPLTSYVLHFDGCSKGNPGKAGIGAVLYNDGEEVWALHSYLGDKRTNNEAEYSALILGLTHVVEQGIKQLIVKGDSLLVIQQLKGVYKVKSPTLLELYNQVQELVKQFDYIDFIHVYRNENKRADQLSNMGIE